MEPVVSPWLIYALSLLNPIKAFAACAAVIVSMLTFFLLVGLGIDKLDGGNMVTRVRKYILKIVIGAVVIVAISLVIPSRETMIAMYLARITTHDNAKQVAELLLRGKDGIKQDVIDVLRALKEDKK